MNPATKRSIEKSVKVSVAVTLLLTGLVTAFHNAIVSAVAPLMEQMGRLEQKVDVGFQTLEARRECLCQKQETE